jgi:hypothetical protein
MSDGVKRYRADRNAEMYQIAYIDEELGKSEPDPILRDVWVADADYDALAARLEATVTALENCRQNTLTDGTPCFCWNAPPEGTPHLNFCREARAVLAKERP